MEEQAGNRNPGLLKAACGAGVASEGSLQGNPDIAHLLNRSCRSWSTAPQWTGGPWGY